MDNQIATRWERIDETSWLRATYNSFRSTEATLTISGLSWKHV